MREPVRVRSRVRRLIGVREAHSSIRKREFFIAWQSDDAQPRSVSPPCRLHLASSLICAVGRPKGSRASISSNGTADRFRLLRPRLRRLFDWPSSRAGSRRTPWRLCSRLQRRHTAATWLMRAGVDRWEAAGFLGMSVEMLDRVYGHHHLDHLRTAAHFIGERPREKFAVPLAGARPASQHIPQPIGIIGGPGRTRTCNQTVMSIPTLPEKSDKSDT
jgi:hypothetical protein